MPTPVEQANVVPSLQLDTTSRSDVPEAPSTPRSELGIFTPTFDSRSEVSVASNEPLAPSTPRTDPAIPASPVVSEVSDPVPVIEPSLQVESNDLASEVTSAASIESIAPSSPVHDISPITTPVKPEASSSPASPLLTPMEAPVTVSIIESFSSTHDANILSRGQLNPKRRNPSVLWNPLQR